MLFPLGDDNTGRKTMPVVVYALIGLNVLVFLLQMTAGDSFTAGYATVPYEITHGVDLVSSTKGIPQAAGPTPIYFTLLSSMFMHGSLVHIGGNMLYLWIFGDQIEDLLGHVKFLIFYLVCGFAADFAHILFNWDSVVPTLGASGAIAGVLGAYLVKYPKNNVRVYMFGSVAAVPAIIVLGLWIVLQFVSQFTMDPKTDGVAYMAHIGGFITGIVLVFLLGGRKQLAATAATR